MKKSLFIGLLATGMIFSSCGAPKDFYTTYNSNGHSQLLEHDLPDSVDMFFAVNLFNTEGYSFAVEHVTRKLSDYLPNVPDSEGLLDLFYTEALLPLAESNNVDPQFLDQFMSTNARVLVAVDLPEEYVYVATYVDDIDSLVGMRDDLMNKDLLSPIEGSDGHLLQLNNSEDIYTILRDDRLYLMNSEEALRALEKGKEKLRNTDAFKDASSYVTEPHFLVGFMNYQNIIAMDPAMAELKEQSPEFAAYVGMISGLMGTVNADEHGYTFHASQRLDKEALAGMGMNINRMTSSGLQATGLVGSENVLLYEEIPSLADTLAPVMNMLFASEDAADVRMGLALIEGQLGFDFDTDLGPILNQPAAFVLEDTGSIVPGMSMGFLVTGVEENAKTVYEGLRSAMDRGIGYLRMEAENAGQAELLDSFLITEDHDTYVRYIFDLEPILDEAPDSSDLPAVALKTLRDLELSLNFGVKDDFLFLSINSLPSGENMLSSMTGKMENITHSGYAYLDPQSVATYLDRVFRFAELFEPFPEDAATAIDIAMDIMNSIEYIDAYSVVKDENLIDSQIRIELVK